MRTPRHLSEKSREAIRQRELEEDRLAMEEDRHRYDDIDPGLNEATDRVFGQASGPPPIYEPEPLPVPRGYTLGPNILAHVPDFPASCKPRDARPECERIIQQTASEFRGGQLDWLWPGKIPRGKFSLLVGDPGVGKSLVTLDLAARVTRGRPWPGTGGQPALPGRVLLLSAEDGPADTIRPRLEKAGAHLQRVELLWGLSGRDDSRRNPRTWQRPIVLPEDLLTIERLLAQFYQEEPTPEVLEFYAKHPLDPQVAASLEAAAPFALPIRLVIIDPLAAYFPAMNSNDNVQVRKLLQPLVDLAAKYNVTILGVTHLNKAVSQQAQYRTLGSTAFNAVARSIWGISRNPADPERRCFLPVKNNLGPTPKGMSFRIVDNGIEWDTAAATQNWETMLASESRVACWQERKQVAEWLVKVLAEGERRASEVQSEARELGFAPRTLRRAVVAMNLDIQQKFIEGTRGWFWSLPQSPTPGSYAPGGHLRETALGGNPETQAVSPVANTSQPSEGWPPEVAI